MNTNKLRLLLLAVLVGVLVWPTHAPEASYLPSIIKSVQQVVATSDGVSTTYSITLSPTLLSAANAILIYNGQNQATASGLYSKAVTSRAVITNTTTVTVTVGGATGVASQIVYRGTVLEFPGNLVKSSGCGTVSIADSANSGTATITAVNTAKTILAYTGYTFTTATLTLDGANDSEQETMADLVLTNSTTITAHSVWNGNLLRPAGRVVGYCYLEGK